MYSSDILRNRSCTIVQYFKVSFVCVTPKVWPRRDSSEESFGRLLQKESFEDGFGNKDLKPTKSPFARVFRKNVANDTMELQKSPLEPLF